MKIALLISGHTRSFEHTLPNLEELISSLSADVFIHTWDKPDMSSATWREPEKYALPLCNERQLRDAINPIKVKIEVADPRLVGGIYKDHKNHVTGIKGAHYMIYGMAKCFELFEEYAGKNGVKYDAVIRYRFDIKLFEYEFIKDACKRVSNRDNLVLMAPHNWASAVGAYFDGCIVASPKCYKSLLNRILDELNGSISKMISVEPFICEMLLCSIARRNRFELDNLLSKIEIIRANGLAEQEFSKSYIGIVSRLRSNCSIAVIVNKLGAVGKTSYVDSIWREHVGFVTRYLVTHFYPLYLVVRGFIKRT
jgi:hypothetical protein